MDKKKSSDTKRSKEESKSIKKKDAKKNQVKDMKQSNKSLKEKQSYNEDNTNQGCNQSFSKVQKGSKNIICKKDSDNSKLKLNEGQIKIDMDEDIVCSSLNDAKEGWSVKTNNKKKTSHQSLIEEQNSNKNVQNQSTCSKTYSADATKNHKKAHDRNNYNLQESTIHKSRIEERDRWNVKPKNKNKTSHQSLSEEQNDHKNVQNQSTCSKTYSADATKNHKKVHDRNNYNLQESTIHKSRIEGRDRSNVKPKNKKKTSHQSLSEEQNDHKNVQNQSTCSETYSADDTSYNHSVTSKQKKAHEDGKSVFEEIDEDIFNLPKDYSLAHCVAEDLRMGAGIAVDFKNYFGGVGKLVDQKLKIGDVGVVNRHDQYVFYLITKKISNGKPTMITMEKALRSLLNKMKELNLTKLGIPKIGCGLDKLDWSDTKSLIINIFSGSGIHITVCVPSKLLDSKAPLRRLNVYITPNHLWEMEAKTMIILFIDLEEVCNKNWIDDTVDKVNVKYPFKKNLLKDVKHKKLVPGEVMCYDVHNERIVCIFTIQDAYYRSLEKGFKFIDRTIKYYKYMAIQGGPIEPSDNFKHISWIVLIWRSVIHSSELWLCGVANQTNGMIYDQYCKSIYSSMNYSFQFNSPSQKNNTFNSYNKNKISNQNSFYKK